MGSGVSLRVPPTANLETEADASLYTFTTAALMIRTWWVSGWTLPPREHTPATHIGGAALHSTVLGQLLQQCCRCSCGTRWQYHVAGALFWRRAAIPCLCSGVVHYKLTLLCLEVILYNRRCIRCQFFGDRPDPGFSPSDFVANVTRRGDRPSFCRTTVSAEKSRRRRMAVSTLSAASFSVANPQGYVPEDASSATPLISSCSHFVLLRALA